MVWRRFHFSLLPLCPCADCQSPTTFLWALGPSLPTSTAASGSSSSLICTLLTLLHIVVIIHPSLPDLCLFAVLSCLAPASPIAAALSRGRNDGWENATSGGEQLWRTATGTSRSHQVSQAASASLMGTLDQIQTGPPRILFTGETPHACWRCCFVESYSILSDANRHWLQGPGTGVLKADTARH